MLQIWRKQNAGSFADGRKRALLLVDALRVLQAIPGATYANAVLKGRTLANFNNMTIGMQFPGGWKALHDSEAPLKDISVRIAPPRWQSQNASHS